MARLGTRGIHGPRARLAQAAERGVAVRVVRAWSLPAGAWETRSDVVAGERASLDALVSGAQDQYPQVKVTSDVVVEQPAAALATASATAQLLVVGSRGRGALRGMLLGSVSQHVLRHSACTVIVLHEPPLA